MTTDALLDLLDSCTRIEVSPRFDEFHRVVMVIALWRDDVQLAPEHRTDFADCSRLLNQMREVGFRTAQVGQEGLTLVRHLTSVV